MMAYLSTEIDGDGHSEGDSDERHVMAATFATYGIGFEREGESIVFDIIRYLY